MADELQNPSESGDISTPLAQLRDRANFPAHSPRDLIRPGFWITGVYVLLFLTYSGFQHTALWAMKPNELGDFLAGCFAPLAFLWLVLGFFQQGDELKNSVAALKLQGEELRNSVEQQRQLVEVTREQLGLDHAKLLSEAEAAVRQAEPIFHISCSIKQGSRIREGDGFLPARYYSKFTVSNMGAECRRLEFSDGGTSNIKFPSFPKYNRFDFRYEIVKNNEIKSLTLTISCTDLLGNDLQFEMVLEPHQGQYGPEYRVSRDDGLFTKVS